jgi:hypothetical protein
MSRKMVWCQTVIKQIKRCEGFDVIIKHDGRALPKKYKLSRYEYKVALKNTRNVKAWKDIRFKKRYTGYEVVVLNAKRKPVIGGTHLGTVRDTYLA